MLITTHSISYRLIYFKKNIGYLSYYHSIRNLPSLFLNLTLPSLILTAFPLQPHSLIFLLSDSFLGKSLVLMMLFPHLAIDVAPKSPLFSLNVMHDPHSGHRLFHCLVSSEKNLRSLLIAKLPKRLRYLHISRREVFPS